MSAVEQIITENLPLWSSSVQLKSTQGRGSSSKRDLYGIKKLRELILDLAVRGLLVPQDPNDEPASVLLEKLALEKEQLLKLGKLKKEKSSGRAALKKEPFKIPSNWQWANLPDVCSYQIGKTPATKNPSYWDESSDGIPWVSIADMNHFGQILSTKKNVSIEAANNVFKYKPVKAGNILMSFKLTLGKISKLNIDAFHNEAIISLNIFNNIDNDFIFHFLPARAKSGNSKAAIKGKTLNSESLAAILLPIPPLAEQNRIVAKLDELMALCYTLEQQQENSIEAHETIVETLFSTLTNAPDAEAFQSAWQRVSEHFDTLLTTEHSVDKLKETILQLAMMGKLVPQDPNDEPASVLLENISTEKERLKSEGKLKINKISPLIEQDIESEIPEKWQWVRFGEIATHNSGKTLDKARNKGPLRKYITTSNLYWGQFLIDEESLKEMPIEESELGKCQAEYNDLLICEGGDAGRAAVWPFKMSICFQNHIHRARFFGEINPYFISRFLQKINATGEINRYRKGIGISNMSGKALSSIPIPLPPLAEQNRIVAKLDELMALCDELKQQINNAQATQMQLTDAVVENAF